jgi:glycosyltransferase involved in cell wall biosynthesis
MESRIALTWGLSSIHGWGVFGINLVKELLLNRTNGWPEPLLLNETEMQTIHEVYHPMVAPLAEEQAKLAQDSAHLQQVGLKDVLVLHSSGNGLIRTAVSDRYVGERNFGFTFFEETNFPDQAMEHAKSMNGMRAGSMWNARHLCDLGIENVKCIHQGVDTDVFQPRSQAGRFGDKFVVFAAGKLEYRKAQDLVVAAFKKFVTRRPDAVLVTVWQNPWPESALTLSESTHISTLPDFSKSPAEAIMSWTQSEGISEGAHIDLGVVGNADLPHILCDADVAVFPNRCEGGTNLALMECMASGIPCIVSMNSGHLDIANSENSYPLERQSPVDDPHGHRQVWGESEIDEIIEQLDAVYLDRARAKEVGLRGAARMQEMTWARQIAALIQSLQD